MTKMMSLLFNVKTLLHVNTIQPVYEISLRVLTKYSLESHVYIHARHALKKRKKCT